MVRAVSGPDEKYLNGPTMRALEIPVKAGPIGARDRSERS